MKQLCGDKSSVYSVYLEDEKKTLFDRFITENQKDYLQELKNMSGRLRTIGRTTGARENYFKLKEGKPGDGVCALYDEKGRILRLYCIRYGACLVIIGGGGPKLVDTWEEDEKLSNEVRFMIQVSKDISKRIDEREIYFTDDGMNLEGNLNFNYEDEE